MKVELFIRFNKTDLYGNIIKEGKWKKTNSLVQGFIAWMQPILTNQNSISSINDYAGVSRSSISGSTWLSGTGGDAGIGVTTHGIVVGSGTNAVAITDYTLQTPIAHGTGSGQLQWQAMTTDAYFTISGSTAYIQKSRTFLANLVNNVTINEIGIVSNISGTTQRFLMERTLPTPFTVTVGTGVKIDYMFQVTV